MRSCLCYTHLSLFFSVSQYLLLDLRWFVFSVLILNYVVCLFSIFLSIKAVEMIWCVNNFCDLMRILLMLSRNVRNYFSLIREKQQFDLRSATIWNIRYFVNRGNVKILWFSTWNTPQLSQWWFIKLIKTFHTFFRL